MKPMISTICHRLYNQYLLLATLGSFFVTLLTLRGRARLARPRFASQVQSLAFLTSQANALEDELVNVACQLVDTMNLSAATFGNMGFEQH